MSPAESAELRTLHDRVVAEANAWGGTTMPAELRELYDSLEADWYEAAHGQNWEASWSFGAAKWIMRSQKARAAAGGGTASFSFVGPLAAAGGVLVGGLLGWVITRFGRR